jgi:hypothetical protein
MLINCCYHCEDRHYKCHAHCETYITQKMLKIMVEAQSEKNKKINIGIQNQKIMQAEKVMHRNYQKRRK